MKTSSVLVLLILAIGILVAVRFVVRQAPDTQKSMALTLTTPIFKDGEGIPPTYTCDGENVIPPLEIGNVPEETVSLVLIMDDPDIPDFVKESRGIDVFDHWVIFNIPPRTTNISAGEAPEGVHGTNSSGENAYTGPCPPDGEHRYFFKLYALDTALDLPEGATKTEVEEAMTGHILEQTVLMGRYNRQQ